MDSKNNCIDERILKGSNSIPVADIGDVIVADPFRRKITKTTANITVVARKRPLLNSERHQGSHDAVLLDPSSTKRLSVSEEKRDLTGALQTLSQEFEFDRVYGGSHSTAEVYEDCVVPLVEKFIYNGGKNSLFTYGQTGSGKTFSVLGCPTHFKKNPRADVVTSISDPSSSSSHSSIVVEGEEPYKLPKKHWGFIQFAVKRIWDHFEEIPGMLRVSCYEMYSNKVFDLLNDRNVLRPLEGRGGDVSVHGLEFAYCSSPDQVFDAIHHALKSRVVGSNARNRTSSRGHLVASLEIVDELPASSIVSASLQKDSFARITVSASEQEMQEGGRNHPNSRLGGKLAFIDLAGTERGSDTTDKFAKTNHESANINKSLLALKECFRAIDSGNSHVPFRNSQLTKVLREFLVPVDACTLMMVHVSPASNGIESAINALQYTSMVKDLRRRCEPLLAKAPSPPDTNEQYRVIGPPSSMKKIINSSDNQKDASRNLRARRRHTILPPEVHESLASHNRPSSIGRQRKSLIKEDFNARRCVRKPAWRVGNSAYLKSGGNTLNGTCVSSSNTNISCASPYDMILPSPDPRNNISNQTTSRGLIAPTPRPTGVGSLPVESNNNIVGRNLSLPSNLRKTVRPKSSTTSPLLSPQSIPSRVTAIGLKRNDNLTLNELEEIIMKEGFDINRLVLIKCHLLNHLSGVFKDIENNKNKLSESSVNSLRSIHRLETLCLAKLRSIMNDMKDFNELQVDTNIGSSSNDTALILKPPEGDVTLSDTHGMDVVLSSISPSGDLEMRDNQFSPVGINDMNLPVMTGNELERFDIEKLTYALNCDDLMNGGHNESRGLRSPTFPS